MRGTEIYLAGKRDLSFFRITNYWDVIWGYARVVSVRAEMSLTAIGQRGELHCGAA